LGQAAAGRATQALPTAKCGLPVQQSPSHANACLTCPTFLTTAGRLRRQVVLVVAVSCWARADQPGAALLASRSFVGPRSVHCHPRCMPALIVVRDSWFDFGFA
jgi:hypothetical protein